LFVGLSVIDQCISPFEGAAKHALIEIKSLNNENSAFVSEAAKAWADAIRSVAQPGPPKNFLIFVNPVGGRGLAVSIFRTIVEPILKQSGIAFRLVVTERQGHAQDMLATDPSVLDYTAAVSVGGDGLLYEVRSPLSTCSFIYVF
jgi:hypothetical protein